ncbi:MAG: hypothetical protein ACI399_05260 [Candidatus Cryptobacteroides sp.]
MRKTFATLSVLLAFACSLCAGSLKAPRFINIVNFVRQVEPRVGDGMEDELYQCTANQLCLLNRCGLKGTFLLQYDAMIDLRYQYLLKVKLQEGSEIGAWWEITRPHVEAAGLEWRGAYSWDWHADVCFSTGYTQEERKILVDVYMEKFREIFGYYPKSVGSWYIDAFTLEYMQQEYGIVASCICRDQYGTDGYTLWGGYWNQAYYPSRVNAYMPAQTEEGQIPVPVFRMLGSDPVYQYDSGIGGRMQGVVTLEPVCTSNGAGGGVPDWVDWYLTMIAEGECLAFNYAQAGQENSFMWDSMSAGYEYQLAAFRKMIDEGSLVEATLSECGQWFKDNFKLTPPTSVVAEDDYLLSAKRSIWYDSRFYRANLYWDGAEFRFRDIHLFDENKRSEYYDKAGTTTDCLFTTLPVVDGFLWSTRENLAGLRLVSGGKSLAIASPVVERRGRSTLVLKGKTLNGRIRIVLKEDRIIVRMPFAKEKWSLELSADPKAELPFGAVSSTCIEAEEYGYAYSLRLKKGSFATSDDCVWKALPSCGSIVFDTVQNR